MSLDKFIVEALQWMLTGGHAQHHSTIPARTQWAIPHKQTRPVRVFYFLE